MIKFKYFKSLDGYNTYSSTIENDDIVFIEDAKSLVTHGELYKFVPDDAITSLPEDLAYIGDVDGEAFVQETEIDANGYIINQQQNIDNSWKLPEDVIMIDTPAMNNNKLVLVDNDVQYASAIRRIRENSHLYIGRYDSESGKLKCRLVSDVDKTKWASDSTSIVYGDEDDLFMKLPEFWWKVKYLEDNLYKVVFCTNPNMVDNTWNHWEGNTFIGVYEGYVNDSKLYSKSGVTPTVNKSWTDFTAAARNRYNNNKYRCITYEAHCIMALLGYGWLGTTDAQSIVGVGTSSYPKTTGLCNNKGMSDSKSTVDGNSTSINFWGLENWWGDIYEWIDNIKTAGSQKINILGENRSTVVRTVSGLHTGTTGEIKQMVLGQYGDLLPITIEANSNYNRMYADYGYVYGGSGYVARRSSYASYLNGGLGCLDAYYGVGSAGGNIGSRLLYKGDYIEVNSF